MPRTRSADRLVVVSTARLIEAVRSRSGLAYDDADFSPVSPMTFELVARQMGTRLEERPLPVGIQEVGLPGYFGAPRIIVSSALAPGVRDLARRHGLAHLIAGELGEEGAGEVRFMSSILDDMSLEERRADLFALADLVPDRAIDAALLDGMKLSRLPDWLARETRAFAPQWRRRRLEDRARLRVDLYYERRG